MSLRMQPCKNYYKNRNKRKKYEGFFKKVELFESMDNYEMTKIMDAVKPICYKEGDIIIKEVMY